MVHLFSQGNASLGQVIGADLDGDLVTREDSNEVHSHLSGDVGEDFMSVFQDDLEDGVGQCLFDLGVHSDSFFFYHTSR